MIILTTQMLIQILPCGLYDPFGTLGGVKQLSAPSQNSGALSKQMTSNSRKRLVSEVVESTSVESLNVDNWGGICCLCVQRGIGEGVICGRGQITLTYKYSNLLSYIPCILLFVLTSVISW